MRHIAVIIFLIGMLLWVPASHADVYSWTDENGVKHFGNQPPDDAQNVKMVFKEKPYDASADRQRSMTENKELTELIQALEEEEEREAAEAQRKAEEAEKNRKPTQMERVEAEQQRLEEKIAELEEKPLEYFGSQKNKRVRLGYYRYRLETLLRDPDQYFIKSSQFEGNVKPPES